MNEGELYKKAKEHDEQWGSYESMMEYSDVKTWLDEAKTEFPILPFPTEKIEFWKMIITQAKIPELTQQQRRELLITILYIIEWFQKWFGEH